MDITVNRCKYAEFYIIFQFWSVINSNGFLLLFFLLFCLNTFVRTCMCIHIYIFIPPARKCWCRTLLDWLINKNIEFRCHSIKLFMRYFYFDFFLQQLYQYYHTQRLSDTKHTHAHTSYTYYQTDNGNEFFRHSSNGKNLSVVVTLHMNDLNVIRVCVFWFV